MGAEGKRNVIVHQLEGLENKGVTCRGRLNMVREGYVDNINDEGRGKEGNSVIVIIGVGKEVGMVREGIGAC